MNFTQLVNEVTRPVSGTCFDHISSIQIILSEYWIYLLSTVASLITYLFLLYANITTSAHLVACRKIRILDIVTWSNSTRIDSKKHWVRPLGIQYSYLMRLMICWTLGSHFSIVLDENCPWMTSSVLKQLHLRDNCLKTARRSNSADDWSNYRAARNKAVAMIRRAKRKFFCNAFEENKGNSRVIWNTIRTLTGSGKNRRDINSINIGEAVTDDKKLMA